MPNEEVLIEIDTDGTPTISVNNVKGPSCKALTASIEDALGSEKKVDHTREFTQAAPVRTTVRAQQR